MWIEPCAEKSPRLSRKVKPYDNMNKYKKYILDLFLSLEEIITISVYHFSLDTLKNDIV